MGDVVSSITLIIIGAINLVAVGPQYRAWRTARRGVAGDHGHGPLHAHAASLEDDGEQVRVEAAGCLVGCACCRYVLGRVDSAWKMYPVGFLFGLGFDTASEVGLLALAALGGAGAADGVPAVLVMLLPALFAAGMALVDTSDGLLVLLALAKGDGADAGALLLGCGLTAASASASLGIGLVTAGGLLARCFLGMDKPKEALMGLNPALMQARREGGAGAVKPHAIAAECRMKLGESDAARVELRALLEAAAERRDEHVRRAARRRRHGGVVHARGAPFAQREQRLADEKGLSS